MGRVDCLFRIYVVVVPSAKLWSLIDRFESWLNESRVWMPEAWQTAVKSRLLPGPLRVKNQSVRLHPVSSRTRLMCWKWPRSAPEARNLTLSMHLMDYLSHNDWMVAVVWWLKGHILSFDGAQVGHRWRGQENSHSTHKKIAKDKITSDMNRSVYCCYDGHVCFSTLPIILYLSFWKAFFAPRVKSIEGVGFFTSYCMCWNVNT
jgi:hypothetical protein